jgi:hypothetical protein
LCGNAALRHQLGISALQTMEAKKLYWQENAKRIGLLIKKFDI